MNINKYNISSWPAPGNKAGSAARRFFAGGQGGYLRILVLAMMLGACAPAREPVAADLLLGAREYADIVSVETLLELNDSAQVPATVETAPLRQIGLRSTGRYKVNLRGPNGGAYKIHVMLFTDAAAAEKHWGQLHRASALAQTQALQAGDAAWIYYGQIERNAMESQAALRRDRVLIEIRARGASQRLADFVKRSAAHVDEVLQR